MSCALSSFTSYAKPLKPVRRHSRLSSRLIEETSVTMETPPNPKEKIISEYKWYLFHFFSFLIISIIFQYMVLYFHFSNIFKYVYYLILFVFICHDVSLYFKGPHHPSSMSRVTNTAATSTGFVAKRPTNPQHAVTSALSKCQCTPWSPLCTDLLGTTLACCTRPL